jgi:hypothetical protein
MEMEPGPWLLFCCPGISSSSPFPTAREASPAICDETLQRFWIDPNTAAETHNYSGGKDFTSAQLIEAGRSYA